MIINLFDTEPKEFHAIDDELLHFRVIRSCLWVLPANRLKLCHELFCEKVVSFSHGEFATKIQISTIPFYHLLDNGLELTTYTTEIDLIDLVDLRY